MASRWAYATTNVRLVEIAPPLVKTKMGNAASSFGEECDEFCEHVFNRFAAGELEIGFKSSEMRRLASRDELDQYCYKIAEMSKPAQY